MKRLCWGMILLFMAAQVICPARATAQVLNAAAGSSSFLNTSGFRLNYQWLPLSGWTGLAFDNGVHFGGFLGTTYRGFNLGVGDQHFPFVLDTDVFDPSSYILFGRGLSVRRQDKTQSWMLFGGTTALEFVSPFVQAYEPSTGIAAFFYERHLSPRLTFHSFNVARDQLTSIQSLGFAVNSHWKVATAGGVGANQGFYAASTQYQLQGLRLTGSYTADGNDFRRVRISNLPYPERTGANLRAELTPWRNLRFQLDHETTLSPIFGSLNALRTTLDAASVSTSLAGFSLNGAISDSRGGPFVTTGRTFDVSRNWGSHVTTFGTFLRIGTQSSHPYDVYLLTSEERLTPRLSVRQTFTHTNENTNTSWGGSVLTNPVTFSLDYETIFNPIAGGFNGRPLLQAWTVNLQFQLPHGLRFHYDNFVDPFGKVRYTAYVSGIQYEPKSAGMETSAPYQGAMGHYVVQGVVQDEQGHPVWGAALQIDGRFVFSDSAGRFFVRFASRKPRTLEVVAGQSLNPGQWQVVSAPATVTPEPEPSSNQVTIILRRLPSSQFRPPEGENKKIAAASPAPLQPPQAAPPPQPSFMAEPPKIEMGKSTTLSWSTSNATDVNIEPNVGKVQTTGSMTLTPGISTTYVLTATGPGGTATTSVRVTVTQPPPPPLPPAPTMSESELVDTNMKDAHFDFDRSGLRPDAQAALTADGDFLKAHPDIRVTIEGNCDDRGSEEYNLGLGERRASSAKKFLVKLGVPPDQIYISSLGKDRPQCTDKTVKCWQKNRRIHFKYGHVTH